MPSHLKALAVILVLATVVFAIAKVPACALATRAGDFERRRNLWFGITLIAFLAHNYWIYIIGTAIVLSLVVPREPNKLALFFFLLFAVPAIPGEISGLGIVNQFFTIHYVRLLSLTILLPSYLFLRKQPDTERFGRSTPDKLIAGYLILQIVLMLSINTVTNTLRHGCFYAFVDVFLPYYVASRSLHSLERFRDALMGFVVAALVLAAVAVFEFLWSWLLYSALEDSLGMRWNMLSYLRRGDDLRALGTTGQPIPLGCVMTVAVGLFLYLKNSVPNKMAWSLGMLLLLAGLAASISRGPWVGAAVMFVVFIALGPSSGSRLVQLGLLGMLALPVVLALPIGEKIIDLLPFIGTVEEKNVLYRQRLLEVGTNLILQNPLFGAYDYMYALEMEGMKQGQGIVDIVNTYLAVGMSSGLVGLSLYAGFFIVVAVGIFRGMRALPDRGSEHHLLGQSLFATLFGILLIIFTVSSITVIPVLLWTLAGLGVAYAKLVRTKAPSEDPESASSHPRALPQGF